MPSLCVELDPMCLTAGGCSLVIYQRKFYAYALKIYNDSRGLSIIYFIHNSFIRQNFMNSGWYSITDEHGLTTFLFFLYLPPLPSVINFVDQLIMDFSRNLISTVS